MGASAISCSRRGNVLIQLGLAVVSMAGWSAAKAEEAPFCRKVRARAQADAALLVSPQVLVQAMHLPANRSDITLQAIESTAPQNQLRAGISYSFLDAYKGLGVLAVAEAECQRHEVQTRIEELLLLGDEAGRLSALRQQAAFLESRRPEWTELVRKEEERFASRVITLVELAEIRARAADLDHRLLKATSEAERIAATEPPHPHPPLESLESTFLERSETVESRSSHVRSLLPWQLKITGGMAVTERPLDWYGLAEVSFNVGAFVQRSREESYLAARAQEQRTERTELAGRLREFRVRAQGRLAQAQRELEAVQRQVAFLSEARRTLERAELSSAGHGAALLALDSISLEAQQAFLRGLLDELATFVEGGHG